MTVRPRAAAVGLILVGTLAGCNTVHTARPARTPQVVVTDDPALDAARTSFTTARAAVLTQIAALAGAAAALDGLDAQAAKGAFDPAMRDQAGAVKKAAAARAALSRLPTSLTTYATSITALASVATSPELSTAQMNALRSLAAAAKSEVAAETAVAAAESKGWSAYTQLGTAQALWLMRADDGFYPHSNDDTYDAQRAGEAYVVLVNPVRSALTAERKALASETSAVNAARAVTAKALAAAGTAFR